MGREGPGILSSRSAAKAHESVAPVVDQLFRAIRCGRIARALQAVHGRVARDSPEFFEWHRENGSPRRFSSVRDNEGILKRPRTTPVSSVPPTYNSGPAGGIRAVVIRQVGLQLQRKRRWHPEARLRPLGCRRWLVVRPIRSPPIPPRSGASIERPAPARRRTSLSEPWAPGLALRVFPAARAVPARYAWFHPASLKEDPAPE